MAILYSNPVDSVDLVQDIDSNLVPDKEQSTESTCSEEFSTEVVPPAYGSEGTLDRKVTGSADQGDNDYIVDTEERSATDTKAESSNATSAISTDRLAVTQRVDQKGKFDIPS